MRPSWLAAIMWLALTSQHAIAQQNSGPTIQINPQHQNGIAQPQQGLPTLVIPDPPEVSNCNSGGVNNPALKNIAGKLRFVLTRKEVEAFQKQIDKLAAQPCSEDRLGAFFLRLLARPQISFVRAK